MSPHEQAVAVQKWFRDHSGYLHPSVSIAHSEQAGFHWQAKTRLEPGTHVVTVPHSLSLSYLNALVDDAYPVFKTHRHDFAVESLGWFYLMVQYIHRQSSFWKPYLDALPSPDSEQTTPLWFNDPADPLWLEGTDVLHTMLERRSVYDDYYAAGVESMKRGGMDVEPYTWDLFRWAITISTSRAFTSRALAPHESKYWATYKTSASGQRQTVLLDMSNVPAEDLDFPVLFPVQDIGNHDPNAHVDWSFDPGRFGITINNAVEVGEEVFNNYGAKGNDELLLGYGFCIPDNPQDGVVLTLKPPPKDLQQELKRVHPGYFVQGGDWISERGTFRLGRHSSLTEPSDVFRTLPEPLVELLLYILRHERGLNFTFYELPAEYILSNPRGRRYLPHIARMIVQSLMPKLQKLQAVKLPAEGPANKKQRQASIYRQGQTEILQGITAALRGFTRSLLKPPLVSGPRFVTLEGLLELWSQHAGLERVVPFVAGIEAMSGTADVDQLRQAGWEEDVMVLLICYIYLDATTSISKELDHATEDEGKGGSDAVASQNRANWVFEMLPEYVEPAAPQHVRQDREVLARAESMLGLVASAAAQVDAASSLWGDRRWSAAFIAELGGKMLQFDSITMMVPRPDGQGEKARLVLYLHSIE